MHRIKYVVYLEEYTYSSFLFGVKKFVKFKNEQVLRNDENVMHNKIF